MKKLLFSLMTLTLMTGIFAQKKADAVAKFTSEVIDLGKIQQGNPTVANFNVANISNEPLIIEQANPTCGCTISDFTKEPIVNGKTGYIKATYNAANLGAFEKHLTVKFAGVDEVKSITIKGEVLSKEDYAKLQPMGDENPKATSEANVTPVKTKTVVKTDGKKTKTKTKNEAVNTANK